MEQPRVGTHYPRSTGEFQAWFRTDADCLDYLDWVRWPGGFTCPSCGHAGGWRLGDGRYECAGCHGRTSVTAGTIFDRTRTPLTVWFTACWLFATQKDGVSAQSLQRSLEIGSYPTAWAMLHRLRSVLVRPGRDRLSGTVEVDETFIGGPEPGLSGGRAKGKKVLTGIAVEVGGPRGIGRCRMAVLADASAESLNPFITGAVEPGSTVITDAWQGYSGLRSLGYTRERRSQRAARARGEDPGELLLNVHRVAALAKRWLLGTHQGSVDEAHLPAYLDEFVFRFNRRSSRSRGLVFYRVLELAAGHDPVRFRDLLAGKKPRPAPATWGLGHPPTLERPAANRPWRTGDLQLQLPIQLRLSKYPRLAVMSGPGVACEVLGLLCDCLVEPVVEDVLGAWVAHVPAVSACDEVFSVALGRGDDAVFDREDRVLHAVDDERTCPQARCGSCGGARGTRRRSPSSGMPSGCRSWRPSKAADRGLSCHCACPARLFRLAGMTIPRPVRHWRS